jgi:glycosyltransferase involved in cell wall biosynthesis
VDTLLHTFALVLEQFPDARLIRVGGPFTEPQQRLAQELKVEGAILSLPFISRQVLASIYRRVTLLLQPSEAEGFGMPVAEAMACGCLVVASDLPALREVGGAAGVYCPVGDISSWRQAVLSLLEQSAQAGGAWLSRRREQSQAQVAQYSWSENARRTVAIYRQVLGLSD